MRPVIVRVGSVGNRYSETEDDANGRRREANAIS